MPIILDASVTIAWLLDDEESPGAERTVELLKTETGLVPAIWPFEVGNTVLNALRGKRLREGDLPRIHALVDSLPVSVEPASADRAINNVLALAREHDLAVYDAAYLELAMRTGYPLATLDDALRAAAQRLGVALVL